MVFLSGQIYVIAQDEDGGWVQLLVFVVMAVIWALGGILKAKRLKDEQREEEPQRQPARPKRAILRPEHRAVGIGEEKTTLRSAFLQNIFPDIEKQRPAKIIKPVETPVVIKRKPLKTTLKRAEKEHIVEDILKLDNPDDLRRAILHYEILGKPLALRQD